MLMIGIKVLILSQLYSGKIKIPKSALACSRDLCTGVVFYGHRSAFLAPK